MKSIACSVRAVTDRPCTSKAYHDSLHVPLESTVLWQCIHSMLGLQLTRPRRRKGEEQQEGGDNGTTRAGDRTASGAIPWPMEQVHVDVVGAHFSERRLYGLGRRQEP